MIYFPADGRQAGRQLYDRVAAVIAEIIANSYDADATEVIITAPMDEMLARKQQASWIDQDFQLKFQITDWECWLMIARNEAEHLPRVGAERRNDPRRGDKSKKFGRRVMGRKGVGKLAPFGVCQKIEVVSSSGGRTEGNDGNGEARRKGLSLHIFS